MLKKSGFFLNIFVTHAVYVPVFTAANPSSANSSVPKSYFVWKIYILISMQAATGREKKRKTERKISGGSKYKIK